MSLALLDTPRAAQAATRAGVSRLMRIALRDAVGRYEKGGPGFAQAALQLKATIPTDRLLADTVNAALERAFLGDDPLPRSEKAFAELVKRARARLPAVMDGAFRLLAEIAAEHLALTQRLAPGAARVGARWCREVRAQRDALVYPGFMTATPWPQLAQLPRYLRALDRRIAKYGERPDRDARHAEQVAQLWRRYEERAERLRQQGGERDPRLEAFRWLARGAAGVAVRAGAQDAVPGVVQAGGEGLGRTCGLNGARAAGRALAPGGRRATVSSR